jgi:prepilin-type N-terminal cleavage/methylation domain-containing protein
MRRAIDQRGMTLIELMVAVVILGIVVSAAFGVAFSILNSYREHRRSVNVERSARGAIAVLTDAVRNGSPGVPSGPIVDLVGCETNPHGIRVDNASDGPDAIGIIYASGGIVTSLRAEFRETSTELLLEDGSKLRVGDQLLVTDFEKGHVVRVDSITPPGADWIVGLSAPQTLCSANPPAPFTYVARSMVLRVQAARFSINTDDPGVPYLQMDPDGTAGPLLPTAVAEGIEDLQIAIGADRDGNGRIDDDDADAGDDDDWVYNHPGDTLLSPPYRAIRLTVIARSIDDTSQEATSTRPGAEDREEAAAPDVFRRRVLSTTVELRNLEGSP